MPAAVEPETVVDRASHRAVELALVLLALAMVLTATVGVLV